MRRSPLPDRDGVSAARLRMPVDGGWRTVAAFLVERTGDATGVHGRLAAGEVVLGDGSRVDGSTPYLPGGSVHLYRDLPAETPVPGTVAVLHADRDLVVVDKPHFLATMPRGRHVAETALVRLRRALDLPDLSPAHRLDRLTAGVLLFTARAAVRGTYQSLFQRREVRKVYEAIAPARPDAPNSMTVRSRIIKPRDSIQAVEVPGEVNAVTTIEVTQGPGDAGGHGLARYRVIPETGRTHQIRVHMARLGLPILNDPLYPVLREHRPADFSAPLQLLARSLEFTDPVSGERRRFTSRQYLHWLRKDEGGERAGLAGG